jgi:ferric-dicitrate binding protein FerR (iron transport regulator)
MSRTAFRELLIRYVNGTVTPAEKALIDHWYEGLYDNNLPVLKQEALDHIEQEMWAHIEKAGNLPVDEMPTIHRPVYRKRLYYITAAAIIIGLAISSYALFFSTGNTFSYEKSKQQNKLAESVNNTEAPQKITLKDGSYVILKPGSKIAYAQQADAAKREVYLEGEAFFEVAKDPARPFFVYTNELVTKVLGTSFDVQAFPYDKTIKVIVHTGKVTIYQRKNNQTGQQLAKSNATIITPNQQVLFNRQQESITRSILLQPRPLSTTSPKSISPQEFTDAPAPDVLMSIQKAYGITILFDEELLSHCSFTGAFTNETFFERINLVCKAIEATYEQADGQVIITGRDCEKQANSPLIH